jgi:hypothetical protein
MPIDKDGTITTPSEGQRYCTRVLVEAEYDAPNPEVAMLQHAMVIGYLSMMTDDLAHMDFRLGYAKTPQPLSPEGRATEEGALSDGS